MLSEEQFSRFLGYSIACYRLADRYGIGHSWKMYVELSGGVPAVRAADATTRPGTATERSWLCQILYAWQPPKPADATGSDEGATAGGVSWPPAVTVWRAKYFAGTVSTERSTGPGSALNAQWTEILARALCSGDQCS